MASESSAESVTLWTSACYLEKKSNSKAKSELQHYFESHVFYNSTAVEISAYLQEREEAARQATIPFIVIAELAGNPVWLPTSLATAFPSIMEVESVQDVLDTKRWEPGTIMLPKIDRGTQSLNFFMQYPIVRSGQTEDFGLRPPIKFCPVATWMAASSSRADSAPQIPIAIMACRDNAIVKRLQDHLVSRNWNVEQLCSAPARIFIDLFTLLSQWSEVWRYVRHELALRDTQLQGEAKPVSVLQQTRGLHRDAANVIAMREDLRLHITAFEKFQRLVQLGEKRKWTILFANEKQAAELEEIIEECLQNLEHQRESSAVIHKQLENLLSLAFNTEMVSQGQAVKRLNTLAFGFLPLSWVATLFGMTNFSISSVWYPPSAVVVVVLVLLAWYLSNTFTNWRIRRNKPSTRPASIKERPSKRISKSQPENSPRTSKEKSQNERLLPNWPLQRSSSPSPSRKKEPDQDSILINPPLSNEAPAPDSVSSLGTSQRSLFSRFLTPHGRRKKQAFGNQEVDLGLYGYGQDNYKVVSPANPGFLSRGYDEIELGTGVHEL